MENQDMSKMTEIEMELAKAELENQKTEKQTANSEMEQENAEMKTIEENQVKAEIVEKKDNDQPTVEETQKNEINIDYNDPAVREQFALMRRRQLGTILSNIGIVCLAICALILVGTILTYITIGLLFICCGGLLLITLIIFFSKAIREL